jgi:hypothetical protein
MDVKDRSRWSVGHARRHQALQTTEDRRRKTAGQEKMNMNIIGAQKRPTLSLLFGGREKAKAPAQAGASPLLTDYELRRLVAAMVD